MFADEYEQAEVKLNDLLVYADTLDYNHSLRDEPPFTRYEVCGVIARVVSVDTMVCQLKMGSITCNG